MPYKQGCCMLQYVMFENTHLPPLKMKCWMKTLWESHIWCKMRLRIHHKSIYSKTVSDDVATDSGKGKIVCVSVVIVVVVVVVMVFVMVVWLCGVPYRGCEDMVIEFEIKDKIVGDVTGHMINITL